MWCSHVCCAFWADSAATTLGLSVVYTSAAFTELRDQLASLMTCVADALFLSNFERNWLTMVMEENLSAKIAFSLLSIMRKLSLVNETLRPETETRPRRLTFSPRRDRDRDVQTFHRDRDETETLGKCVSRPSRDRDVETETTSLTLTQAHNDFCFNHAI